MQPRKTLVELKEELKDVEQKLNKSATSSIFGGFATRFLVRKDVNLKEQKEDLQAKIAEHPDTLAARDNIYRRP